MKYQAIHHPKTMRLKQSLGLSTIEVIGLLEALWQFTGAYADDGDVTEILTDDFPAWIEFSGDGATLTAALIAAGFVDRVEDRLLIHDWLDHAPEFVQKRRRMRVHRDKLRKQATVSPEKNTNGSATVAPQSRHGFDLNATVDDKPNQTQPSDVVLDGQNASPVPVENEIATPDGAMDLSEVGAVADRICKTIGVASDDDRSLVVKVATLVAENRISEDMLEQSLEATRKSTAKNPRSYFHKCMSNQCSGAGVNFNQLLRTCQPPEL